MEGLEQETKDKLEDVARHMSAWAEIAIAAGYTDCDHAIIAEVMAWGLELDARALRGMVSQED